MKVGLIAMSGAMIRDTQLLEMLGHSPGALTRLAAVSSLPSLALLTVAALIRNDVEVQYLQCPSVRQWTDLPGPFDLVAISTYSAQVDEAYELAAAYKATGVPVVIGGPHVSVVPHEAIERGFVAAIGEAEMIWPQIIADAKEGTLKQSYGLLGVTCDITASPVPAFDLLDPEHFRRIPIQTSRGCPHRCEFCAASVLLGPRYRHKTVQQVLQEIDTVLERWDRPFIEFVDDNALVDRVFWRQLLLELKKRQVRWFAECDISVAEDEELLKLMRDSGCREVLIGLESPASGDLEGVELLNNWKFKTQVRYRQTLSTIQRHGIRVIGCFILGLDNQTAQSAELIQEFVEGADLFDVQVTLQTAFPGTPLYRRLQAEGRLKAPDDWRLCTLFDLNISPKGMTDDELLKSYRTLLAKLLSPQAGRARWKRFNERLREMRRADIVQTISA